MVSRLAQTVLWLGLVLTTPGYAQPPQADSAPTKEGFLRLRRTESGDPAALETAIASYSSVKEGKKLQVDLVGAVHVADRAYFTKLNEAFQSYDAVLFELVAPADVVPRPEERSVNAVSLLQLAMKGALELEFQLDCIDYQRANMVHADMTPEEFARSMEQRGESFVQMFFRMLGQSIATQSKDPTRSGDAELFAALFAKPQQRARQLKSILAEQFEELEGATSVLDGPEGSTILTERNKAALRVLAAEIAKGKSRLAIFYGAAHLPDMEKRLLDEFQLQRAGTTWLTAWDLRAPEPLQKPAGK